jgi:hypothetical protein
MSAPAPLGVQALPLPLADLAAFERCGIPPACFPRGVEGAARSFAVA